jgi:hypothetical protein
MARRFTCERRYEQLVTRMSDALDRERVVALRKGKPARAYRLARLMRVLDRHIDAVYWRRLMRMVDSVR